MSRSVPRLVPALGPLALLAMATMAQLSACSSPTVPETAPPPDFALEDVNETSLSFEAMVSPRDFLDEVSAYYFGHAT